MQFKLVLLAILLAIFTPAMAMAEIDNNATNLGIADERLLQATQSLNITLDDTKRANVAQKCQKSQIALAGIESKTDRVARSRIDSYTIIQKELLSLKLRMARQGVDASEIDLLIGRAQQAIDDFVLASNAFGTTLNDLQAINCTDKPELFKAGIMLMRSQQIKLLESAANLKNILKNADKSTFIQLKKRLTL